MFDSLSEARPEARRVGLILESHQLTIATAESMTGGALAEALVPVPGAGEWLAGGVIAYLSRVKFDVLGVEEGPVISESAAKQMASAVAKMMGTDIGVSTTGCAGPESMEDQPIGTVWTGAAINGRSIAAHHLLDGDPRAIRQEAVRRALILVAELVERD